MKLVIVDDDWAMLELMSIFLKRLKHDVHAFSDSMECWKWISDDQNECPDVLISDYMMPYFDGKELIEKIRKESQCQKIAIILMSSIENVESGSNLWDLFMHKNFDYKSLCEYINKAIANKEYKK